MVNIATWIFLVLEIVLTIVAWRVGWRWRALLPVFVEFVVNVITVSFIFYIKGLWSILEVHRYDQATRIQEVEKLIDSLVPGLIALDIVYSSIVIGVLFSMIQVKMLAKNLKTGTIA
jgi:putative Mn2+ efflux pump MntP